MAKSPAKVAVMVLGGSVGLVIVGVVFALADLLEVGVGLALLGGLGIMIGLPLFGAFPAYLAARPLGLSFSDAVESPPRWGAGVRTVRAFKRLCDSGAGVGLTEVGVVAQAGADLSALVEAVEIRRRAGYPADFEAFAAAALAGHDPIPLALSPDVVPALVAAGQPRP